MIIPGRISVAEIIDSPGFHGFRSGARDKGERPHPTCWRTSKPNLPFPKRTGGPGSSARPAEKRRKDPLQRLVMMKCDLRFEAYAVSFLFVSKGCSSPTVVTVMRAGSTPSLTMWSNVALERFLPSTRLYLFVPRMSQ